MIDHKSPGVENKLEILNAEKTEIMIKIHIGKSLQTLLNSSQ